MEPRDWIELGSWRLDCILGVLEREQKTPQPLEIEVRLGLDLERAADGDALDKTVDYAAALITVQTGEVGQAPGQFAVAPFF